MVAFVIQMPYLIGFYFSRQTLLQSKVGVFLYCLYNSRRWSEEAEDVEWPLTPELAGAIQKPLPRMEIWLCTVLDVVGNSKYQSKIHRKKVKHEYSIPHIDVP